MKLSKIGLLTILCLPINLWAIGDGEESEAQAPVEHSEKLSQDEQKMFEKHLEEKVKNNYDLPDDTTTLNKISNYVKKAWYKRGKNNLDDDIKRHMIDPSKINKLNETELNNLRQRLRNRIEEEKDAWWKIGKSKELREDLLSLENNVNTKINQNNAEKNIPTITGHYKRIFSKNIQEFSKIQEQISQKTKELLELQKNIASKERDLINAQQKMQDATSKNDYNLAKAIEENNKTYTTELEKSKKDAKNLTDDIQDLQDRINLDKEETDDALLNLLKTTVSPEKFKALNDLQKKIDAAQFMDINAYTETKSIQEISDPKIKDMETLISELEEIKPSINEVTEYVAFLKNQIKNHFLNLEKEAFLKYTEDDSLYLKTNLAIRSLKEKIENTKRIFDTDKKIADMKKSKEFIKQLDEDISDYQKELEILQKNPKDNKDEINEIKRRIQQIVNEKKAELKERGFNSKDISNYENLSANQKQLTALENQRTQYSTQSQKLSEIKKYFENQISKYNPLK